MPSKEAQELNAFLLKLKKDAEEAGRPTIEYVGAIQSPLGTWMQTYKLGEQYSADDEYNIRLSRKKPQVGDRVLVQRIAGGNRIVFGKLIEAGESDDAGSMYVNGRNFADTSTFDFVPTRLIMDASGFWVNQVNSTEMFVDLRYGTASGQPAEGNHNHDSVYAPINHTHAGIRFGQFSSRYYGPIDLLGAASTTTLALAANTIYFVPVVFGKSGTMDSLGVDVTTVGASSSIRMGVYYADSNNNVGSLVSGPAGVAGTTTGVKLVNPNCAIVAGTLYYLAVGTTVALSIRGFTAALDWYGTTTAGQIDRLVTAQMTAAGGWTAVPNSVSGLSYSATVAPIISGRIV